MAAIAAVIDWMRAAADVVLSVAGALLVLIVAALLPVAAWRAWKQSRRTQMIIGNLLDSTGDPTLSGAALGLTHRLREEVIAILPVVASRVKQAVQWMDSDYMSPMRALWLDDSERRYALIGDIASSQSDLLQSLQHVADNVSEPEDLTRSVDVMVPEAGRGLYRFVATTLLRPREVRVLGLLQRVHEASGGVGLSFTVTHLGPERIAGRVTLWEDEDCDIATKTVVERFHDLIVPAARSLACELLRQRLMVTMSERHGRRGRRRNKELEGHMDPQPLVDLLVGSLYHNGARTSAPAVTSFYELAERDLRRSAERLDDYTLLYQLGRTVAELGRRQARDRAKAIDYLSHSVSLFQRAKSQLDSVSLEEGRLGVNELGIRAAYTTSACLLAELSPDEEAELTEAARLTWELIMIDPADYENDGVLTTSLALLLSQHVC
ncbi:MAG: hypothetical protein LC808_27795 [Actinobacteria bacterium]|nr:hypothetical protein [Actinomycetota bacterium]